MVKPERSLKKIGDMLTGLETDCNSHQHWFVLSLITMETAQIGNWNVLLHTRKPFSPAWACKQTTSTRRDEERRPSLVHVPENGLYEPPER